MHARRWVPTHVHIPEGAHIVSVASGWRHSMCVDSNGLVYSFGWSKYGQLGHGNCRRAGPAQPPQSGADRLFAAAPMCRCRIAMLSDWTQGSLYCSDALLHCLACKLAEHRDDRAAR